MQLSLSKKEKENKVIAGVSTAIICALLLLLLLFVGFKSVDKPEEGEDSGVMVQMGDPNEGGPDNSPMNERQVPVSPQSSEENILTSNQQEAVAVRQPTSPVRNPSQTTQPEQERPRQLDQDAQNAMRDALNARQSRGQGGGQNPGTQGSNDGQGTSTTGGSGGTGTSGSGTGFELGTGLGDRGITYAPIINSRCENAKSGIIKFKVIVSANGNVSIGSQIPERGTTIVDECIRKEALEALKKVKLTPSAAGSESTEGIISVIIKS
jgi:hypothetical protein